MEGSTISIGVKQKKAKIAANLATCQCQGTGDAPKWNECLAPEASVIMHTYFFDNSLRHKLSLPKSNENGKILSKIMCSGKFVMAIRQVEMGHGV